MTKADLNAKICTVKPRQDNTPKGAEEKNLKSQKVGEDTYAKGEKDAYKAMVTGKAATTETSLLEDMVDAMAGTNTQRYRDPVQAYLGSLLFGADKPKPELPQEISVPTFESIRKENPDIFTVANIAEGFVERYEALKDMICGTIKTVKESLSPARTALMTPVEIQNLQQYLKKCEDKLFECNRELTFAKEQHQAARDYEIAETEARLAELEKDWWDED